jgi:hypothetical protein
MKTRIRLLVATLGAGLVLVAVRETRTQMKRVTTLDTMGQILVALDRSLPTNEVPLVEIDLAREVRRQFPNTVTVNGEVADAWGRPIRLSINNVTNGFAIEIVSAGPDGQVGTKDDLVRRDIILFQSHLKSSNLPSTNHEENSSHFVK